VFFDIVSTGCHKGCTAVSSNRPYRFTPTHAELGTSVGAAEPDGCPARRWGTWRKATIESESFGVTLPFVRAHAAILGVSNRFGPECMVVILQIRTEADLRRVPFGLAYRTGPVFPLYAIRRNYLEFFQCRVPYLAAYTFRQFLQKNTILRRLHQPLLALDHKT
jgi:hypothetical protein